MDFRRILLGSFALLVAITSLGLGAARGAASPSEAIVICRGLTAITIWVDDAGNEVPHQDICPAAALALLVSGGAAAQEARWDLARAPVAWAAPAPGAVPALAQGHQDARGPPVLI